MLSGANRIPRGRASKKETSRQLGNVGWDFFSTSQPDFKAALSLHNGNCAAVIQALQNPKYSFYRSQYFAFVISFDCHASEPLGSHVSPSAPFFLVIGLTDIHD